MRTLLTILMATMMLLLTACGGGNAQTGADTSAQKEPQTTSSARSDQRVLVAYFSRADENTGGVGYIEKGNTKILAEMIAERTHGDIFEIKTVKPYPKEYRPATEAARQEKEEHARPEIVGELPDLSKYDVVFLGYPIWWSDFADACLHLPRGGEFRGQNHPAVLHTRRKRTLRHGSHDRRYDEDRGKRRLCSQRTHRTELAR